MNADALVFLTLAFIAGGAIGFLIGRYAFLMIDIPRYLERGPDEPRRPT